MKKAPLLLFFLIVSFGVVPLAQGATASLYLSPSSGTYTVGRTFSVAIKVNSGGTAINAAEGTIDFNPVQLNVVRLSKSGSIFTLWTQEPSFSNSAGNIVFGGGSPKAFKGSAGTILTITFKAKAAGSATVNFSAGMVLAADGKGTNVLAKMSGGIYTLKTAVVSPPTEEAPGQEISPPPVTWGETPAAPVISSITHPEEEKWYSNNDPEFTWKLPSGITGVSLLLHENPVGNPGPISDGLIESKKFEDVEDGIWYFHIKFQNQSGWGEITHRKVLIDTQPPEPFAVEIQRTDSTDPRPVLLFDATDEPSGIADYELKIGEGDNFPVAIAEIERNPYKMPLQAPGDHFTVVKAVDGAGNFTSASENVRVEPLEPPVITEIPQTLEFGQNLFIKGTSLYPEATVRVFVQKENEKASERDVKTDGQGDWSYIHDKLVEEGTYKIWAIVIDSRGAQSLPSEKITLTINPRPLSEIFKSPIIVIIILLVIIGVLISLIFYQGREISRKKKLLRRETEEIEKCVSKTFRALREEVKEQTEFLDSKPGLTRAERKVRDKLKEALDVSEEFIKKEIEDVEKGLE